MKYLLVKQPWVDSLKSEYWFYHEAIPFPCVEETAAFFKGAYFIPEYRVKENPNHNSFKLGTYSTFNFIQSEIRTSKN